MFTLRAWQRNWSDGDVSSIQAIARICLDICSSSFLRLHSLISVICSASRSRARKPTPLPRLRSYGANMLIIGLPNHFPLHTLQAWNALIRTKCNFTCVFLFHTSLYFFPMPGSSQIMLSQLTPQLSSINSETPKCKILALL